MSRGAQSTQGLSCLRIISLPKAYVKLVFDESGKMIFEYKVSLQLTNHCDIACWIVRISNTARNSYASLKFAKARHLLKMLANAHCDSRKWSGVHTFWKKMETDLSVTDFFKRKFCEAVNSYQT